MISLDLVISKRRKVGRGNFITICWENRICSLNHLNNLMKNGIFLENFLKYQEMRWQAGNLLSWSPDKFVRAPGASILLQSIDRPEFVNEFLCIWSKKAEILSKFIHFIKEKHKAWSKKPWKRPFFPHGHQFYHDLSINSDLFSKSFE